MLQSNRIIPVAFLLAGALLWPGTELPAQSLNSGDVIVELEEIAIEQKLDSRVPLDLPFTDQDGSPVLLSRYFGDRPVVLSLVYYECPMLCTEILNGMLKALRVTEFSAGREFEVLTVSIDPGETPALARQKKDFYLDRYRREPGEEGWNFLTGSEDSIASLAAAVGFGFRYEAETDLYSHASGIMILTPDGRVSRYLLGVEYSPRDLRLALVDASAGKIGSPVDQVLLYCFQYDPALGKYSLAIMRVLRGAAILTLIGIGLLLAILFRRDRHPAPAEQP